VQALLLGRVGVQHHFRSGSSYSQKIAANAAELTLGGVESKQYRDDLRGDVIKIGVPSLVACLVEPALSLIDSYFVGFCGNEAAIRAGLAGMMINSCIFNFISCCTSPLCGGTTDVVAKLDGNKEAQLDALYAGSVIAIFGGLAVASIVVGIGPSMVRRAFDLSPQIISLANEYMVIRALSLPISLLNYIVLVRLIHTKIILSSPAYPSLS
jgi:Na+-driven multidrug efflux pump